MNLNNPILYSTITIVSSQLVLLLIKRLLSRFSILKSLEVHRKKVILNLTYLLIYLFTFIVLLPIWGVDFKQMMVFISSVLAVLGVGFFAQWSILSNLTASVILFFYHPVRIGNRVRIIEKDHDWSGTVLNITGFYFFMKTDKGEEISLPNSLVIQRGIELLSKKTIHEKEIISPIES